MSLYRNIRPYPINLENASSGKVFVLQPNDTIELPDAFAQFYVHVLEKVIVAKIEPKFEIKREVPKVENKKEVKEEVLETKEENLEEPSEISEKDIGEVKVPKKARTSSRKSKKEEPVKKGRGRPPKVK